MTIHPVEALVGGLGLFLLGMARLTDGLKIAAGPSLRDFLNSWTSSAGRGLLAGMLVTAIVQSSSAVTVATLGFVNAGLLSLTQAVWLIFGTNIGTTMTSWLVAVVGVKLDVVALALPMVGAGMGLELIGRRRLRLAGLGAALSGFGLFFLGIGILATGFSGVAAQMPVVRADGPVALALAVGLGTLLTVLTPVFKRGGHDGAGGRCQRRGGAAACGCRGDRHQYRHHLHGGICSTRRHGGSTARGAGACRLQRAHRPCRHRAAAAVVRGCDPVWPRSWILALPRRHPPWCWPCSTPCSTLPACF